ncbi:MAG TPA: Flp pilus assembly protein CpaB [Myxococcales bacterium]|jgi:pilus assembly protein CpaB|nr:Flp pilus assembly protein CpaB [Myxococcales bacterium]
MLRGKTPLLVAVILGVLAGAFAFTAIKRKEKEVKQGWNLVPVIVANQDLAEGSVVTYEMISQRPVPEQFITSSVIKPDSASYVVGQRVLVPVQTGDPLLWSQFETSKATERLSTMIVKQGRGLTLDVTSSKMSVGGWVRPNDHVDVIGTFRDPLSGENKAVTLMQNVLVLATGKITGTTNVNLIPEGDREFQTITFLLLPEEAELLSLAADLGSLTLTLRNPEELDVQAERGHSTIATLLTGVRMKELTQQRIQTIELVRGTKRSVEPAAGP